jgi:hypothetical protein
MAYPSNPDLTYNLAQRLARRLESDPEFLAAVFADYKQRRDIDDDRLAANLGTDLLSLQRIAICRKPRPDLFRDDVETIAGEFGIDPAKLADLIRHAEVLAAFAGRPAAAGAPEILAAARDRAAEHGGEYRVGDDEPSKEPETDSKQGDPQ